MGSALPRPSIQRWPSSAITRPTPIQAQAIPPLMKGHDLVGIAQTGTGKTAAFALPILNKLATDRRPAPKGGARVLVLSPTRELASQIAQSFRDLSDGLSLQDRGRVRRRAAWRADSGASGGPRRAGRDARPAAGSSRRSRRAS